MIETVRKTESLFGRIVAVILGWTIMVGIVLFNIWPRHPHTPLQWLALVVLGPVAYLLVAGLAEGLTSKSVSNEISPRPGLSARRMLYLLAVAIVIVVLVHFLVGASGW